MSTVKVQGNASGTGSITLASPNTNSNQTQTLPDVTGTSLVIDSSGNVNNTSGVVNLGSGQVYKDASGNVGIGTSSPTERLGVLSALTGTTAGSNVVARFQTNGNGYDANITLGDNVNASTRLGYLSGNMYFWTNGAERGRFDTSGNLLVGTTSQPLSGWTAKLGITTVSGNHGTAVYVTGTQNIAHLSQGNSSNDYYFGYFLNNAGTNVGNIRCSGTATTYATSSDYRLKEDVQPMVGALEKVAALKPVTYKWKADGSDGEGFIAHELAEVVPQCVTGEKDAVETYIDDEGNEQIRPRYQGIDTSFLVATLTAAIQELKADLDATKAELAALKEAK